METEQWEYLVDTLRADSEEQQEFLQREFPGETFPWYAPEALIPQLNEYGNLGWELVSLVPVIMGTNGDVQVPSHSYTNEYLCTFKRRKSAPD